MTDREQYSPGPAGGAQIEKDGENWTLVLVRETPSPAGKRVAGADRTGTFA
jgi:hypothetical protein